MAKEILRKLPGTIVGIVLSLVPLLLVKVFSTQIIQGSGVHLNNTLQVIAYVIAAAGIAISLAALIVRIVKLSAEERQKTLTEQQLEEYKAEKERREKSAKAKLNVREPLNDTVIYERLKSWLNEDWGRMTATRIPALMSDILRQMSDMNAYQSKLSRLLTNNGADYLDDTNAVLESVEQCILRKVRKILNCFVVYETNRVDDVKKMEQILEDTRSGNETQLNNVKEFLFAITDFLNKQGEDDTGIERLNIYKKTILESTNDPD